MTVVPLQSLSIRKAGAADMPFLTKLRRRTMWNHLQKSGVAIDDAEQLQRVLYRFDCAYIVTNCGQDIGLLKVCRDEDPWELIQLQLAPEQQQRGIGKTILEALLLEARDAGVSVQLNVLRANPAKRLYERFGFSVVDQTRFEYVMRWTGDTSTARVAAPLT